MDTKDLFFTQDTDHDSGLLLLKILNYRKHKEPLLTERLCDRLVIDCIRTVLGQRPLDCVHERGSRKSN